MLAPIKRVLQAMAELKKGKMIILTDHPDRENEGDLIFPAEIINATIMNFMIRHGSGIVCLSLRPAQIKKLNLNFMIPPHENSSQRGTPFTVSIEAKEGVKTGVSAEDRTRTILTAIKEDVKADELVKPGHVFPLVANEDGVLARPGHTEGALDLVRLAGFKQGAVLCEVMNTDGSMAHGQQLTAFANEHDLFILSIEELIAYRRQHENLIADEVSADLPLEKWGHFTIHIVKEKINADEHIVLSKPFIKNDTPMLLRIHSSCVTGDLFGSQRCDCNQQLQFALQKISEQGGMLIYLQQEGRGIGLFNKIKAYTLQQQGMDTLEANQFLGLPIDAREYYLAANILRNRGIKSVRLLTNNPAKVQGLQQCGIDVQQETMTVHCNVHNKNYLQAKKTKLNHHINLNVT